MFILCWFFLTCSFSSALVWVILSSFRCFLAMSTRCRNSWVNLMFVSLASCKNLQSLIMSSYAACGHLNTRSREHDFKVIGIMVKLQMLSDWAAPSTSQCLSEWIWGCVMDRHQRPVRNPEITWSSWASESTDPLFKTKKKKQNKKKMKKFSMIFGLLPHLKTSWTYKSVEWQHESSYQRYLCVSVNK